MNEEQTVIHKRVPMGGAPRERNASLLVLSGRALGQLFKIPPGEMVLGRSTEADIRLDDEGVSRLHAKIRKFRPRVIALVGVTVFRAMFPQHKGRVVVGLQRQMLDRTPVFVLPNTSGRNANFSYAEMLAAFKSLKRFVGNRKTQIPKPKSQ